MRQIQRQAFLTIKIVALLTLGLGLTGWYGLHQASQTVLDFEARTLPEISAALNLSENVAHLAALAPYVSGSAKPFQLQTERNHLEQQFAELKKVADNLKDSDFKLNLSSRLVKFRMYLDELIEQIEEELFLREDLLAEKFALNELNRQGQISQIKPSKEPFDFFSMLYFLLDQENEPLESQRRILEAALESIKSEHYDIQLTRAIENLIVETINIHTRKQKINQRKLFLLASLRAQSGLLAQQVNQFVAQIQNEVLLKRRQVQSQVRNAYMLMVVMAVLLILGMLYHYRYTYRMTRDLSLVTQDMLNLANGHTDTRKIGILREDEIGELARAYNIFRDDSIKIKEFSDHLSRQKTMLETVFNQMNDGLSVFSPDNKLISWNKRYLEIFDLSENEVFINRPLSELHALTIKKPHEYRSITNDPVDISAMNELRHNQSQTFELHYHTGKIVEFRSQPMPNGGFVTLYSDLTRRRAVEAQLHQAQKMEMMGQLTGGVAHDFNNLLAAILGNLQLLSATTGLDEKQKKYTDRALMVSEKGVNLVQRLLAFSRIQQLYPEPLNVNELIFAMLDLVEYSMGPGIRILTQFTSDEMVFVDPSQLENALLNLAVNSSAAMPDGGTLTFITEHQIMPESQKECIAVIVEDTGAGIPLEIEKRVLEPFFTTKPAGQGSGMGLSMVYGFVKQSGGEMIIRSTPGNGTKITLLLPIMEQNQVIQIHQKDQSVEPCLIPEGKKILLVEDNFQVCQAVSEQIESLGFSTLPVKNAELALDMFQDRPDDIAMVLTDISLSGPLSGVDLKNRLYGKRPEIRVVMTSGLPRENLEKQYGLKSEDRVIAKPISFSILNQLLIHKS